MEVIFIPSVIMNNYLSKYNGISKEIIKSGNIYDREYIAVLNNSIKKFDNVKLQKIDPLGTDTKWDGERVYIDNDVIFCIIDDVDADNIINDKQEVLPNYINKIIDVVGLDRGRLIALGFNYYMK